MLERSAVLTTGRNIAEENSFAHDKSNTRGGFGPKPGNKLLLYLVAEVRTCQRGFDHTNEATQGHVRRAVIEESAPRPSEEPMGRVQRG